jgi:hypothetical protein
MDEAGIAKTLDSKLDFHHVFLREPVVSLWLVSPGQVFD